MESCDNRVGSDRSKTRTAVLVTNDIDYSPVAFGDAAYVRYAERYLQDEKQARKELLLFDYFKMTLATDEKSDSHKRPMVMSTTGEIAP